MLIQAEAVNRKRDLLYHCHMVFNHGPAPLRLEAVLSPFILTREMNVITDDNRHQDTHWTHFSQDMYLLNIDSTTRSFFRHTSGEN